MGRRLWILLLAQPLGLVGCTTQGPALPPDDIRAIPVHGIDVSGPVRLEADVQWQGADSLRLILRVANLGEDSVVVSTGECPFRLRAFADGSLSEPAVWDDHPPDRTYCPDVGYEYRIGPGASGEIVRFVPGSLTALGLPRQPAFYGLVIKEGDRLRVLPAGQLAGP